MFVHNAQMRLTPVQLWNTKKAISSYLLPRLQIIRPFRFQCQTSPLAVTKKKKFTRCQFASRPPIFAIFYVTIYRWTWFFPFASSPTFITPTTVRIGQNRLFDAIIVSSGGDGGAVTHLDTGREKCPVQRWHIKNDWRRISLK